jgi:hypothetical protein
MFKFSSLGKGISFMAENNYRTELVTNNLYYIFPSKIPEGYPAIGKNRLLPIGILLTNGNFHVCNTEHNKLACYHSSLENLLAQKKVLSTLC